MFLGNFKDEDFLQDSHDPFIETRETTNILNTLVPDESSRSAISENFIQSFSTKGRKSIKTEFHLQWALECIGYSFSLPPKKYFSTIISSVTIYSDWLLFPEYAPDFIKSRRCFYVREMIGHLSIVFYSQKDQAKQFEICSEVLSLLEKFSDLSGHTEETWIFLLKIGIDISREVMGNTKIVDVLGSRALRFLFKLFLKTKSRNHLIWREFKDFLWKSCYFVWVSVYWGECLKGLTRSVVKVLMNSQKKMLKITFPAKSSKDLFTLDKDPESLIYLWSRFLNIFLFSDRLVPSHRLYILLGVTSSIDIFLKKCDILNSSKPVDVPKDLLSSSNAKLNTLMENSYKSFVRYMNNEYRLPSFSVVTLLNVFGPVLFQVTTEKQYHNSEKIEAYKALCKIFCRAEGPYPLAYVEKFLFCIMEGVANKDTAILSVICEEFTKIPSINMTFFNYILKTDTIIQIVSYFLIGNQSNFDTKKASFSLLSTFAPMASYYNISGLTQQISDIFLQSIKTENDEVCLSVLIWSVVGFLAGFKGDSDLLNSYFKELSDKVETFDAFNPNFKLLVDALLILPYLVNRKEVNLNSAKYVVFKLLSILLKKTRIDEEKTFKVLECVFEYVYNFPEVFEDENFRLEVLRVVEFKKTDEKLKDFCCYLTEIFMGKIGRRDTDRCEDLKKNWVRSVELCTEDIHISAKEQHKEIEAVINNYIGRSHWRLVEVGYDEHLKSPNDLKFEITPGVSWPHTKTEDIDLEMDFDHKEKILQKLSSQKAVQEAHQKLEKKIDFRKAGKLKVGYEKNLKNLRRIVTMMGYLDVDNLYPIFKLDKDSDQVLCKYDELDVRPLLSIKVIYLPTPESRETDFMKKVQSYSSLFKSFLNSIGKLLKASDYHPSSIDPYIEKYSDIIYTYSDLYEAIVTCPSMLPQDKQFSFIDFIESSNCVLIWNQRINDSESKKLPECLYLLNNMQKPTILVTPISSYLLRVNTFGFASGPLMNNMVVNIKMLLKLLFANVYYLSESTGQRFMMWRRKGEFLKKNCVETGKEFQVGIKNLMWMFEEA